VLPQQAVGQAAVRYLAGRGHKRILAAMPAELEVPRFRDARLKGANAEATKRDIRLSVLLTDADPKSRTLALQSVLDQRDAPTAIYAYNDEHALDLLDSLRELGIAVPDDVALLGCDDSPLASASRPRLSSVQLWPRTILKKAVDAVDALVQGKEVKRTLRADPLKVTERDTA
jgi:DNA-binding LacI/PurR family transcriptional regulator